MYSHLKRFPFFKQLDSMDCGPTCLRMVAKYYGKSYSLPDLRERCYIDREGVSLRGISEAAEQVGFRSLGVKIPFWEKRDIPSLREAPLPAILHWNQNHFVVAYKVTKDHIWIADPASGKYKVPVTNFKKSWLPDGKQGIALLLEPTPAFYQRDDESTKLGFRFLTQYLRPHSRLIFQVFLGLILSSLFLLVVPFLTQSLVDIGIDNRNLNFIYLVLAGQVMIFLGQTAVRFIQSWLLLHISVRMNVNLISDFLAKLMRLPISFFDAKHTGDLLQRIGDHRRIEHFLTQNSLTTLMSIINLVIYSIVLLIYSIPIFLISLMASIFYLLWIALFLKMRREVDYLAFQHLSDNQDSLIEIIQGISEIKLQGSALRRRWKWAGIQAKYFRTQLRSLAIGQYQDAGALGVTQLKDILITFIAAKAVLEGHITLGTMLAIQFIIGQLNAPLQQLVTFIRSGQDAKISLERLNEIHGTGDEEPDIAGKSHFIPSGDIILENVSFKYTPIADLVLDQVSFSIPRGKTTAIVGMSGCGKTTLIKLLLASHRCTSGRITIGGTPLTTIYTDTWRQHCGAVMQEGYVFSDTIARNIAESDDEVDMQKVVTAAQTANLMDLIESLPLGFQTMVGARGNGISRGQQQRLLIARAVYKNPDFVFLDEATNALDANNEREIIRNLDTFLENKTTVIVAHRLSTVQHADQIVVIDKGRVVELGDHKSLTGKRGHYYKLVKNQLELGG